MRWLAGLSVFVALASGQSSVTVSNVTVDGMDHSSLRLRWDNSTAINAVRVRYGHTIFYEAGPGGGIFRPGTSLFSRLGQTASLSGLAPGSTYHFCPQSSVDGGQSWSPCVDLEVTLPPLPAVHPALPEPPTEVNTRYPAQHGATWQVDADCGNLQTLMNQARGGDTITIPAGTTCSDTYVLPTAPEALRFESSAVDTLTGEITLPGHGFLDGQKVHLDTEGCLPGSAGPDIFCQLRGILPGSDYFVRRITADRFSLTNAAGQALRFEVATFTVNPSTGTLDMPEGFRLRPGTRIQVRSNGVLPDGLEPRRDYYVLATAAPEAVRLSLTPDGPPVPLSGAGQGTHSFVDPGEGKHAIMAWPPPESWIVVRTATPDDRFCPERVRCLGALWAPRMARIAQVTKPSGTLSDVRLHTGILSHHWRFVGIEFTHADNSAAVLTSADPTPYYGFINTRRTSSHIVFDRCYIHGLGFPNRIYRAIVALDGENIAITNSDLENLDYWHPSISSAQDFVPTITSPRTLRIAPGNYFMGAAKAVVSTPAVITLEGNGSGSAIVYLTLDGAMVVELPSGVQGTCTGPPCTVKISSGTSPAYPEDSTGRIAVAQVADLQIQNGQFVSASHTAGYPRSATSSEGAQSLIAGNGPGPVLLENNLISGTGIPIHFDDSGGPWYERHDYVVRRNLFTAPLSQGGGPESDGYRYFHRNMLEWKGGHRILVEGNIFEHNFGEVAPLGAALVITPRSGGDVSDVMIRDNTFRKNAGGLMLAAVDSYNPVSKPLQRVSVVNNLFHHNNGYKYAVPAARSATTGILVYLGYAASDFRFDHNTVYDNSGFNPTLFHFVLNPVEGVSITNNFLWINDDSSRRGISGESFSSCPGTAKALMDCIFTAGEKQTAYTFSRNLLFPGWTSSSARTQLVDPQNLRAAYAGLPDVWVAEGATLADRLAQVGIGDIGEQGGDFRIAPTSPYAAGGPLQASDGTAIGADIGRLEQKQGLLTSPAITEVTQTSASVQFLAPDPDAACYVLYGTGASIADFTRTPANLSDQRLRSFSLTGLREGTRYSVLAMCAGASNFAAGSFTTSPVRRR